VSLKTDTCTVTVGYNKLFAIPDVPRKQIVQVSTSKHSHVCWVW